ncbi:MAG: LAGLIDADG family homing endonuclease [Patescibacteria group bacterium]
MRPLGKVKIEWSPELAYVIGLLVTDGGLSSDSRHISFTSKDLELIDNFQKGLGIKLRIGKKANSSHGDKKYYVVQIGDVIFYRFLLDIGLMPRKTKIIGAVKIPEEYLVDFLRGHMDGDGTFYSYLDSRWKSSFVFYSVFVSASKEHIYWLREKIFDKIGVKGHINMSTGHSVYQLKYAKKESLKLFSELYYDNNVICLTRKRLKMEKAFELNEKYSNARVAKLVDAPP